MYLSNAEITWNYNKSYQFTSQLLTSKYREVGVSEDARQAEFANVCQSALGTEAAVQLITTVAFSEAVYRPVLEQALTDVKKSFFPDVAKRRFHSIDAGGMELSSDGVDVASENADGGNDATAMRAFFRNHLSEASYRYLLEKILPQLPNWPAKLEGWYQSQQNSGRVENAHNSRGNLSSPNSIERKLQLFRKFYPDGNIRNTARLSAESTLSKQDVQVIYLNIYLEIDACFPTNFLQIDGDERAAIIVRFLIQDVIETTPENILSEKDDLFFFHHHLQNVYRYFNYSMNRVLQNAFPEIIPPWLLSRTQSRYWDSAENRLTAIRWLVENRLGIAPAELFRHSVSKKDFANHGLSYMFNKFYNSVSRALAAAYPEMNPWETGNVPFDYWTEQTTANAIRWMIKKLGWELAEIPAKARSRELNSKTFSHFGLATVFEKKLAKNVFRAIDTAWPGRFLHRDFKRKIRRLRNLPENPMQEKHWSAA